MYFSKLFHSKKNLRYCSILLLCHIVSGRTATRCYKSLSIGLKENQSCKDISVTATTKTTTTTTTTARRIRRGGTARETLWRNKIIITTMKLDLKHHFFNLHFFQTCSQEGLEAKFHFSRCLASCKSNARRANHTRLADSPDRRENCTLQKSTQMSLHVLFRQILQLNSNELPHKRSFIAGCSSNKHEAFEIH